MADLTLDERKALKHNLQSPDAAKLYFSELRNRFKQNIKELERKQEDHPEQTPDILYLINAPTFRIEESEIFEAIVLNQIETREFIEGTIDAILRKNTEKDLQAVRKRIEDSTR